MKRRNGGGGGTVYNVPGLVHRHSTVACVSGIILSDEELCIIPSPPNPHTSSPPPRQNQDIHAELAKEAREQELMRVSISRHNGNSSSSTATSSHNGGGRGGTGVGGDGSPARAGSDSGSGSAVGDEAFWDGGGGASGRAAVDPTNEVSPGHQMVDGRP